MGRGTKTDVILRTLALMQVAYDVKRNGKHIDLVSDADRLDTEIIGHDPCRGGGEHEPT